MPEGPIGGPRPLVTTNLKYDVVVTMEQALYSDEERKAIDIVDVRVNSPQTPFPTWLRDEIGSVLLAGNKLSYPSGFKVINEEVNARSVGMRPREADTVFADEGEVEVTWTYVMRGVNIGKFANTSTTSGRVADIHQVLIEGNNDPLRNAQAFRGFSTGPAEIHKVEITTE